MVIRITRLSRMALLHGLPAVPLFLLTIMPAPDGLAGGNGGFPFITVLHPPVVE